MPLVNVKLIEGVSPEAPMTTAHVKALAAGRPEPVPSAPIAR